MHLGTGVAHHTFCDYLSITGLCLLGQCSEWSGMRGGLRE